MKPRMDRRRFLHLGGSSLFLLGGWGRGLASTTTRGRGLAVTTTSGDGVLVVVFQRGAADALHMLVPYRDRRYKEIRGALALEEPGRGESPTLDLGGGFAFHPALSSLYPLYESGHLGAVVNVGSPDPTRSHFDAQDYMESGTPGRKATRDGWLTRALDAVEGGAESAFSGVSLTGQMPRSLAGARHAIALQDFQDLEARRNRDPLLDELERLYERESSAAFSAAGEEGFEALEIFRAADPLSRPVRAGVRYPRGRSGEPFRQLAQLLKSGLGIRVAFVESPGWDTHFAQGGATGQMANLMRGLSDGVSGFIADVGDDVPLTVLVVTEFGRTVAPNGAGGTDHGHGGVMLAAGAGIEGGKVHGDWLGLARKDLYQGRDLPVTTDFRDVFSDVATRTLGLSRAAELFPGHRSQPSGVVKGG